MMNPYSPPNHNSNVDQNWIYRGNVTGVTSWVNIGAGTTITRNKKFDVFGNVVQADVSCCQVKNLYFRHNTTESATQSCAYSAEGFNRFW
jgi:hypothetical protein